MTIFALCDYQGRFGSKHFDTPYRSGMDKKLLMEAFKQYGVSIEFCAMSAPYLMESLVNNYFLYTSQEDAGYLYKSFIEDVVYGLELAGAYPIPSYKHLRANNDKVFMEMLRRLMLPQKYQIQSRWIGAAEEAYSDDNRIALPLVVKDSEGASSRGVSLAESYRSLKKRLTKSARSRYYVYEIHDYLRSLKHKGYTRESQHRRKHVLQEFIPGMSNDWKVLVYGDRYYVLRRQNRPGDFRASGSGLFSFDVSVNPIILDAAREIKETFNVPNVSIDLAISENKAILIEFQFVYFGTSTLEKSPYYYTVKDSEWKQVHEKSVLEEVYAKSICEYLGNTH